MIHDFLNTSNNPISLFINQTFSYLFSTSFEDDYIVQNYFLILKCIDKE